MTPTTTRTNPAWTKAQCTTLLVACSKAKISDEERYMLMRYVGCPSDPGTDRPSLKSIRNTNQQFGWLMSLVESHAEARGVIIRPPREHKSWHAAVASPREAEAKLARAIAREAAERLPLQFNAGVLDAAVRHVADHTSHPLLAGVKPESIDHCDGPTTHRVVECLRAWVGRYFTEAGLKPRCFTVPRAARERAERRSSCTTTTPTAPTHASQRPGTGASPRPSSSPSPRPSSVPCYSPPGSSADLALMADG